MDRGRTGELLAPAVAQGAGVTGRFYYGYRQAIREAAAKGEVTLLAERFDQGAAA